jgi:ABC-type multidrug transport system fused ATPase/permease subunit
MHFSRTFKESFMQRSIFFRAYSILTHGQRKQGTLVVTLLVFQSLLDFFSIASFLPLIFLIVNPNFVQTNSAVREIFLYFGFSDTATFIIAAASMILLFTLFKGLCGYWITRMKANFIFQVGAELSSKALSRYVSLGYPAFSEADFSKEQNKVLNQPITFANSIVLPITTLLSEGLIFLMISVCIVAYDVKIIGLIAAIAIPVAFLYRLIRKRAKHIGNTIREKYPVLMKRAQQVIEGLTEIKLYRKESYFRDRFGNTNDQLRDAFAMDHAIQSSIVRLTEIVGAVVVCFLIIYTTWNQKSYQETILLLSIYAGASFRIIPSINRLFVAFYQLKTHEHLINDLKDASEFSESPAMEKSVVQFKERLDLREISFSYAGRQEVFRRANFTVFKGSKVALTGKSGEGKTTLLLILLGFINNYDGELLIDGEKVTATAMRNILGYVPQNPYLLDATLLENIAFGIPPEHIDRSKVGSIIRNLELEELVSTMPNGLDTTIGERGVKLSGGQRQRIAIARALYADADIFLFDEVTNQVHASVEREILGLIAQLSTQGKTVIMVTHKLADPRFFDVIYNLERGELKQVSVAV